MKYTTINIQGNLISEEILQKVESGEAQGQKAIEFGFEPNVNIRSEIEYAWSRVKLDWKYFSEKSQNLPTKDPYGTTLSRNWIKLFLTTLGFELERPDAALIGDNNQSYSISHVAANLDQLPVHIVGFKEPNNPDKNTLDVKTSGGTSRFSPHATMQEYLNVTEHVYGIAANGLFLRLIRDSGRLIKLTYVEFDLKRMLDEDKYSEFTLLYRLLHATRFPRTQSEADQCFLEKYYQDSIETGNRIRDGLSLAVKESLLALGKGFLQQESNIALREKIQSGRLSSKDYYRQLLRIIYRFLFLMVTEERDLVYDPDDKTEATQRLKKVYLQFYSIARLRKLCANRYVYESQFNDLWQGLVQTFQLFEAIGNVKKLGIQPLDGDLFNSRAIQDLEECLISNKLLLECVRNMNEFRDEKKNLVNINYRSLDVEELGSVYEGLLELHPVIENIEVTNPANINFTFHEGTDRKTTGSYYTRPELVNELIKSALIPVIEERLKAQAGNKEAQAQALLKLKVCDAAAGSGHMLLAAARTIAWYLARVQSGEENPAPSVYRSCLREVIQHCIYAVDFNPDAVELCKLALWLEGHNSGKPLSFLDHKIRNGNSLVGVSDLGVLQKGLPDDAFNPVTGDDKKVCQELKRENAKYNKTKQTTLDFDQSCKIDTTDITGDYKELENIRQDDLEGVKQVKTKFDKLRSNHTWFYDWRACNLWTAAFFWNYTEENKQAAPNSERLAKFLQSPAAAYGPMIGKADALSMEYKFFHWPLEFPDVFEQGGFDLMLGNPPWEIIELKEQEFFSTSNSKIAKAENKAERTKLINYLKTEDPVLFEQYEKESHNYEAARKFLKVSGRNPLTAVGRINMYPVFAENFLNLINSDGRAGIIIPTGIATDDGNKAFFGKLIESNHLVSLFDFENREGIFQDVHRSYKFCLLTIAGKNIVKQKANFGFFLTNIEQMKDELRVFSFSKEDFLRLNPNTKTCPVFRTRIDADLNNKIYKNAFLNFFDSNKIKLTQGLYNLSNDNKLGFIIENTKKAFNEPIPLIEGKAIYRYDHRYASFDGKDYSVCDTKSSEALSLSKYEVEKSDLINRSNQMGWKRKWFFVYRDVTNSTNEITVIATITPFYAPVYTVHTVFSNDFTSVDYSLLVSLMNSLPFDYFTRQKIGGMHLSDHIINQLPFLKLNELRTLPKNKIGEILELIYSSWDIKAFADDIWKESDADLRAAIQQQWEANQGATGGHQWAPPEWHDDYGRTPSEVEGCPLPPFKWDEERRAVLKAELDAIYAKLYGLTTEELRYILDPQDVYGPDFPGETFRVLKEKEIKQFGEFRTRRLVLEAWERLNKNES